MMLLLGFAACSLPVDSSGTPSALTLTFSPDTPSGATAQLEVTGTGPGSFSGSPYTFTDTPSFPVAAGTWTVVANGPWAITGGDTGGEGGTCHGEGAVTVAEGEAAEYTLILGCPVGWSD